MTFSENTQFVRNQNLLTAELDQDVVMMDEAQGYYFSINPIGKSIWEILAAPTSYQDLLNQLLEIYEVTQTQCEKDLQPFLADLVKNKLITVV